MKRHPNPYVRCKETRLDGKPCEAHPRLVGEDGFCHAHRPGAHARLVDQGKKGGAVQAANWRRIKGQLMPGELPELLTPHDAQKALDVVAHAVAEGRLPHRQAAETTRAIREWLRAWEAGAVADKLTELGAEIAKLKGEKKLKRLK